MAECAPNIRFINALPGTNITITTQTIGSIRLAYKEVSNYTLVNEGALSVNVVDDNGVIYTNVPILITFNTYITVAAVMRNGSFFLIPFNETNTIATTGPTQSFVRLIDLATSPRYLSVNTNLGSIFSYVGFLESTPYSAIDSTAVTQFQALESLTSNYFPITMTGSLSASSAYTIFFFSSVNETGNGIVTFDRSVSASLTTGKGMTTGAVSATTGRVPSSTTGHAPSASTTGSSVSSTGSQKITTGSQMMPSTSSEQPIDFDSESSSASLVQIAAFSILSSLLLCSF
jgi:hypothetical protein